MDVNLDDLREAYKQAVEDGKESFMYKKLELNTEYTKFLIEYLETLKTP